MDNDSSEIKTLERIVWKTAISTRLECFTKVLEKEGSEKHFGEEFVTQLSVKTDRLLRLMFILGLAYTILMLSLFVAQDSSKTEFEIFGYGFKNLGQYKELLLFLAALTSPLSALITLYRKYLSELRTAVLKRLYPDQDAREFRSHLYADNYLEPLFKGNLSPYVKQHSVTLLLQVLFAFVTVLLLCFFLIASFILQVAVIYDVATNPASSKLINLFIVTFSIAAISVSWLIGILQLPLPEVDLSGHEKLDLLRNTDKEKYDETLKRLSADATRKERAWTRGTSAGLFVLIYSLTAVFLFPQKLQHLDSFIAASILGLVLCTSIPTAAFPKLRLALYAIYFRRHPQGTDSGLKIFSRYTKAIGIVRLVLQLLISLIYSLLILGRA